MPVAGATGVSGNWLRVGLPEGEEGFIHQSLVKTLQEPVQEMTASTLKIIREAPVENASATGIIREQDQISVFNAYNTYLLVRSGNTFGWIEPET